MVFVDLKISIWCIFLSFLGVQISSRMIENCHEFYYLGHYRSRSQPMFTSNTPCLFPLRSLILQSFLPSHASIHLTATFRRSRRLGAKCPCKLKSLIISGEERGEKSERNEPQWMQNWANSGREGESEDKVWRARQLVLGICFDLCPPRLYRVV